MKSIRTLLLTTFAAMTLGGIAALHAQDAAAPAPAPAAAAPADGHAPATHKKSLLDQYKQGGPIMHLIALCSVGTLFLAIDGMLRTARSRVIPPQHLAALQSYFRQGDYVGAYNYCKTNKSPFTNVTRGGLSQLGEGKQATEEALVQEVSKESSHMSHYIAYLSVIGVCTPMIGLIGTVSGMIGAFDALGTSGIGDPSKLSHAIGEVLVATFSGLLIAVPAFGLYYYLRNRSANAVHGIVETINSLFRKMPYEHLAGAHIGGEEIYANTPNWVSTNVASATEINA